MVVQFIVYGVNKEKMTIDVCEHENDLAKITVRQLKQKAARRLPGNAESTVSDLRLIFGKVKLEGDDQPLVQYGLIHRSAIHLVMTLDGTTRINRMGDNRQKCYDPRDHTLTFVDGDDEMDFLCEGPKSLRAKMSCGHAVTPTSLTTWCRRQLDEGETSFSCGVCRAKWSYMEVRKMALLTPEEREEFEKTMAFNTARTGLGCKKCPGCQSLVLRKDESNLSVRCSLCTVTKRRAYEFCWQCLREWKGRQPRSDRCDNEGCSNQALKTLMTCKEIVFESVTGVKGCPSIRACPTCGLLLEHSSKRCKNLTCSQCNVEFCFVCLKLTQECLKTSSYYIPCSSGVAPRQTSIPRWNQM